MSSVWFCHVSFMSFRMHYVLMCSLASFWCFNKSIYTVVSTPLQFRNFSSIYCERWQLLRRKIHLSNIKNGLMELVLQFLFHSPLAEWYVIQLFSSWWWWWRWWWFGPMRLEVTHQPCFRLRARLCVLAEWQAGRFPEYFYVHPDGECHSLLFVDRGSTLSHKPKH